MTPKQVLEILQELAQLIVSDVESGVYQIVISPYATDALNDVPAYSVTVERATAHQQSDSGKFYGTSYRLLSEETVKP